MGTADSNVYVIVHGPGHDGTRYSLKEGITSLGRFPDNDIVLLGDLVSRNHSRIAFFEGRATFQDLDSHNGSWVNGTRVRAYVLNNGDVCTVGNFRLSFHQGSDHVGSTSAEEATENFLNSEYEGLFEPNAPVASGAVSLSEQIQRARSGEVAGGRAVQLLLRANEALVRAEDLHTYLHQIVALSIAETGAREGAFVTLPPEGSLRLEVARSTREPIAEPKLATGVARWTLEKNFPVSSGDLGVDLRFAETASEAGPLVSVLCVPASMEGEVLGALYLSRIAPEFRETELDVVTALAQLAATGIVQLSRRKAAIEESFAASVLSRFHSPEIADILSRHAPLGRDPTPALEARAASILHLTLVGLDALAGPLPPASLTPILDRIVERIGDIALARAGAIFVSGGASFVLAFEQGRIPHAGSPQAAAAALEIRDVVEEAAKALPEPRIRVRQGIETGPVLLGSAGGANRVQGLLVGAAAEAAAGLCLAAPPGTILLGPAASEELRTAFELKPFSGASQGHALAGYEILGRR